MENYCSVCKQQCPDVSAFVEHLTSEMHNQRVAFYGRQSVGQCDGGNRNSLRDDELEDIPADFICRVCNIPCTGIFPYRQHVQGEKHKKKVASLVPSPSAYQQMRDQPQCSSLNMNLQYMGSNFHCKLCNVPCSGVFPFEQHIAGEKHRKKVAIANQKSANNDHVQDSTVSSNMLNSAESVNAKDPTLKLEYMEVDASPSSSNTDTSHKSGMQEQYGAFGNDSSCQNASIKEPLKPATFEKISLYDNQDSMQVNFYCNICNINCSGFAQYKQHIIGKNHTKKINIQAINLRLTEMMANAQKESVNMKPKTVVDSLPSMQLPKTTSQVENGSPCASVGIAPNDSGSYYCDTCKIPCNALSQYQQHVAGEKHIKNVALQNQFPGDNSTSDPPNDFSTNGMASPNFGDDGQFNVSDEDRKELNLKFKIIDSNKVVYFDP